MGDKEFATVTDSGEIVGGNSALLLQGANTREGHLDRMARFLRGSQINDQSGTSYTTVLNDAGKTVRMSNAAANTLTIPPNSSVAYKIGTRIWVTQIGAGTTTLVQGSGVTINKATTLILGTQWQPVSLLKVAINTWDLTKGVEFELDDLSDVDLTTTAPRTNDRIAWNGTSFVPVGASICRLALKVESYTQATNKVLTWTEVEDTDSYFGGGTVADEHVVFPFTGRYRISYQLTFAATTATDFVILMFGRLNRGATTTGNNDFGGAFHLARRHTTPSTSSEMVINDSGIIIDVTATDEMDLLVQMWHGSGTRDTVADGYWIIEYMGVTP